MTAIEIVTKVCGDCGEEKPAGYFHRAKSSKDGRHYYCIVCNRRRARESAARQREALGDEAYLRHKRRIVDRSRRNPEVRERTRLASRVTAEAMRRLRENHRDEYDRLRALVWSEVEHGEFR